MGWRQMVVGAVVGQVAEFLRERKQNAKAHATVRPGEDGNAEDVVDRAPGGRLNPLNAAEDMLKRVVDHAQYRTDQSVVRAADEVLQKAEQRLPGVLGDLEATGNRVSDRAAERFATLVSQNVSTMDALLRQHRTDAESQLKRLVLIALGGFATVGVGLILLAWALFR